VEKFDAGDDVEPVTDQTSMIPFYNWIAQENVEALPEPPKCFLDRKLLIMPIFVRAENPGHAFQRMAALNDIARAVYPNTPPSQLTTVYLFVDERPEYNTIGGYRYYLSTVSHSHFALFGHGNRTLMERFGLTQFTEELLRSKDGAVKKESIDAWLDAPMCFREGTVYFTCRHSECQEVKQRKTARPTYPMYWYRSAEIQRRFVNRLTECVTGTAATGGSSALQKSAATDSSIIHRFDRRPVVVYSLRSSTRRWTLSPLLADSMGKLVDRLNGTFIVHEMSKDTVANALRLYLSADIVIAPYGGGLFFGVMMRPGSVAIEINFESFHCSSVSGINMPQNRHCDYGGNFWEADIHHVVASLPATSEREIRPHDVTLSGMLTSIDHDVGTPLVQYLVTRGVCLWQQSARLAQGGGAAVEAAKPEALPKQCRLEQQDLSDLQHSHYTDVGGDVWRTLTVLSREYGSKKQPLPRMDWLSTHSVDVAQVLRPWRTIRFPTPAKILVVVSCGDPEGSLLPELTLLRAYLPSPTAVHYLTLYSGELPGSRPARGSTSDCRWLRATSPQILQKVRAVPCRLSEDAAAEGQTQLCERYDVIFASDASESALRDAVKGFQWSSLALLPEGRPATDDGPVVFGLGTLPLNIVK
jgi:hypothetical protein